MYILQRHQQLETDLNTLWDFLKNPYNLNTITPPDLNFEIISDVPETMFNGLIIEYRITIPLIGCQQWVTEIKHIRERRSFVDEQRLGPYTFWYHYHEISQTSTGVLNSDTVYYQPPLGLIGKFLNRTFISKTLNRIFDFRRQKLHELFSN